MSTLCLKAVFGPNADKGLGARSTPHKRGREEERGGGGGNVVYLFLDDGGAGNDSDYDDLLVRIVAVPEPASFGILLLDLAGLGLASRRRAA